MSLAPRTVVAVCIALGVLVTAQDKLAVAMHTNLVLVEVTTNLSPKVTPLSAKDLVHRSNRFVSGSCVTALSDLQQISPGHSESRLPVLLGVLLSACGQPEQAETVLRSTATVRSSLIPLAIACTQQGKEAEALAVLRRTSESASMLAVNGEAAYWGGEHDIALPLLEMSLAIDSVPTRDKAQIYQHLSLLHEARNHGDEAMRYAQLWVDTAPEDHESSMFLAGLNLRRGHTENAYLVLRRAEEAGASSHPLFPGYMGRVYDLRGDLEQAIPLYREAVARRPNDVYMKWYLGQALYYYGDDLAASAYLKFVAQSGPPNLQKPATELVNQISRDAE